MLADIFNSNYLKAVEVTAAMENLPTLPQFINQLNIFSVVRVRTRTIAIGNKDGVLSLIPTSPIGAPPVELELRGRDVRPFNTRRLAKGSTLYAEDLTGVLNSPDSLILRTIQQELADRGQALAQDFELTKEHMRFGALQGKVVDADGTTVLDDWYDAWGISVPATINFHLDVTTTNIRAICDLVVETIRTAGKSAFVPGQTEVHALCGSSFYSLLISHPMVERLYLGWAAAQDLAGKVDDDFQFGGITFHRFRGTDDNSTIAIPSGECRFFPVGARDAFQEVYSPAEFEPFIGEQGRDIYGITIPDRDRGAFTRLENYSYPLFICLRPGMLLKGVQS